MIPLVLGFFGPFTYDAYTLPKIALAAMLVMIAGNLRGFSEKPLTKPLCWMFAAVCFSASFSGDATVNLMGRYCARYLGVLPLAVCFLAYHLKPAKNIGLQIRIAGGFLAAYGLAQLVYNPLGYEVLSAGHRIIGTMGSPPALGCALAMCLPFCFGKTLGRGCLTAIVLCALVATGSRGPQVAGVVAMLFVLDPRKSVLDFYAFFSVIAILVAGICLRHSGASDQIRWITWVDSLKMWWAHPWFGCGAESYVDYWRVFRDATWVKLCGPEFQDYAHNDLIEALAAFGVVGFAAYLNLLWRVVNSDLDRISLASLVAVFICAKFNAVPIAVMFSLALVLGAREEGHGFSRVPAVLAATLASVFLYTLIGDTQFYRARRVLDFPGVMRAVENNPTELFYQAHEADLLTRKWIEDRNPDLLLRALVVSRQALKTHPVSVQARHMVTQNLLFLAETDPGYLAEALDSAEKLYALDPQLNYQFHVVVK